MKLRTPLSALVGSLALSAPACDSGSGTSSGGGVATVTGRYQASGGAQSDTRAELVSVDDDGGTSVIATGNVSVDGTFRIEAPAGDGPFLVEVRGAGDASLLGRVVVPHDLMSGETVSTMAVDAESSAEARAYLEILRGDAGRDDVDAIGLMSWVSTDLAAEVKDAAALGAAWMAAQRGWFEASAQAEATLSANAVAALKAEAFKDFAASGGTVADEIAFHQEVAAALQAELPLATQVAAELTASTLGAAALGGGASELAAESGARLVAHVSLAQQQSVTTSAEARARIAAAYEAFFQALASGGSMASAEADLVVSLGGDGLVSAGSALSETASAEGVSQVELRLAMASAAALDVTSRLESRIAAALEGAASTRATAVASAVIDARHEARTHFTGLFPGAIATASLASELFVMTGHAQTLLDLDLFASLSSAISIQGSVGAQIASATTASLWTFTGELIASGEVDGGSFAIGGLMAADLSEPRILAVGDGEAWLAWAGAIIVDARAGGSGTVTLAEPISFLSTARGEVAIALTDLGETPREAMAMANAEVDAELAAIATDTGSAQTVATSLLAHALVESELRGSADGRAAVAADLFAAGMANAVDGDGDTAWRLIAEAHIDAATELATNAGSTLTGARFAAVRAEVEAAVDAFVDAANGANTRAEAEAAWEVFVQTMTEGDVEQELEAALSLDALMAARLSGLQDSAVAARTSLEGIVQGAIDQAVTGSGPSGEVASRASLEAAAEAVAAGGVAFDTALTAALDLSFLAHLGSSDRQAAARFMAEVTATCGAANAPSAPLSP